MSDETNVGDPTQRSLSETLAAAAARDPLLVARERMHGDFRTTADIAQVLKRMVRHYRPELPNTQLEALDMICVKMARVLSGDASWEDHWADIAGYAKLGQEGCSRG